jgi:ribosomal protein S12 methylthiotransferase
VQGASAYLKIADGCRRPCAFCAIPLIKGTAVSRPPEAILDEARAPARAGRARDHLIAQDTTDYGHDLGLKDGLARLLEKLAPPRPKVTGCASCTPTRLCDRPADRGDGRPPQVVPYLDMPLQHAHPMTLRRMRRPANIDWVHRTLEKMRAAMPDLALRTTFIVGYPGETEEEFQTLLDFVRRSVRPGGRFPILLRAGHHQRAAGRPGPGGSQAGALRALMETPAAHLAGAQPGVWWAGPCPCSSRAQAMAFRWGAATATRPRSTAW